MPPTKLKAYQTIQSGCLFKAWARDQIDIQGCGPIIKVSIQNSLIYLPKPKVMEKPEEIQPNIWILGIDVSKDSIDACLIRNFRRADLRKQVPQQLVRIPSPEVLV